MLEKTLHFLIDQSLKGNDEAISVLCEEHLVKQINYSHIVSHSQEGGRLLFPKFIAQSAHVAKTSASAESSQNEQIRNLLSHLLHTNLSLLAFTFENAHQHGFQLPLFRGPKHFYLYFTPSAQQLVHDAKELKHFIKEENEEALQSVFSTLFSSLKSKDDSFNRTNLQCFSAQIAYAYLLKDKPLGKIFLDNWEPLSIQDKAIAIYLYSAQAVWRPSANISNFSDAYERFGVKSEATFVSHTIQECLFLQKHQGNGVFNPKALEHFFKILPPTEKSQFFEISPDVLNAFLLFYEHNDIEKTPYKQVCIDFLNSYTAESLKIASSQLSETSSKVLEKSSHLEKLLLNAQHHVAKNPRRAL